MPSDLQRSEDCKQRGNTLFRKGKFNAAIEAYTEAICLCNTVSVYFSNRAMCQHKLARWPLVQRDARQALELDPHNLKAMYLLGSSLCEVGDDAEGIATMEEAYRVAEREKNLPPLMKELRGALNGKYKQRWQRQAALNSAEESAAREYLRAAMGDALVGRLRDIREGKEGEGKEGSNEAACEALQAEHEKYVAVLERVFDVAAGRWREGEVPEHLCGQITMDLMDDPVITPSGLSYERGAITEHLRRNGSTDPITRQTLWEKDLVPNIAVRHATSAFLKAHPWAWEQI